MFYLLSFILVWAVVGEVTPINPYREDPYCIGRIVGESMGNRSYEFSHSCDLEPLAKPYKNFPPSFFIIGAQKAGTTHLNHFLVKHTVMNLGCGKELHFLKYRPDVLSDMYSHRSARLKYQSLMCNHTGPIIDGSPGTFTLGNLFIQNLRYTVILRKIPKMVFLLRDPLIRAYSGYNMRLRRNKETGRTAKSFKGLTEYNLDTFEGLIEFDLDKLRNCGMDINLDNPNFDPRTFYSDDLLWCYHDPDRKVDKVLIMGLYSWFLEMLRRSGNPNRVLVACYSDFVMENDGFTHMVANFIGVNVTINSNGGRQMEPSKMRQKVCPMAYRKKYNLQVTPEYERSLYNFYRKWNKVLMEDFGIDCGWGRTLTC